MTGRIFTADHQVYDLPPLLEWNVKHTGSVPCDSWSVTAVYQAEMAPVLKMAAGFAAMENGAAQLRGIVDEYRRPKLAYETVKKWFESKGNYR